ncbi:MAG: DNA-3-methyladenine glycosylase 2 [Oscillospiraceae bacterium]|nr:DNA-3-methyladenine glycosylase 2 [Oscillospiraceae bacterium]
MEYFIKLENIDLETTFNCGQCFRRPFNVSQAENGIILHNIKKADIPYWENYFCTDEDYTELIKRFSQDKIMKVACEYAPGIRVLRQDPFEALISFIISQNNNIKRISGIIAKMCECFGENNAFPTAEVLAEADLSLLKTGYRTRYITDAARKVHTGEIKLDEIHNMPYNEARHELMKIVGVGEKVADCVLLFGFHKTEAFPRDVWIKRVMSEYYPNGLPDCIKGYEGIAQQFLFHYIRNNNN